MASNASAPPPPPSAAANAANGAYNGAANAGQGNGAMPTAGHFADMATLMQNLETLSGWLQQNREDFEGVREGLRRVEALPVQERGHRGLENGVIEEEGQDGEEGGETLAQTNAQLRHDLAAASDRIATLESTLASYKSLSAFCTTTVQQTVNLVRNYTYSQQTYIASLHSHYTALLQNSRYETLEAQLIHQKWQEGLARVSEACRTAVRARDREADSGGFRAEIKGLRLENRLLRRKVGWDVKDESEEDLEGEYEEGESRRESAGRPVGEGGGA